MFKPIKVDTSKESLEKIKKIVVLLSSNNIAKINSTKKVLGKYFLDYELKCFSTTSNVSNTPKTDEESLLGCYNRNLELKTLSTADIYISLEGNISKISNMWFLGGWAMVSCDEYNFYGKSAMIKIDNNIVKEVLNDNSANLSDIVIKMYGNMAKEVITNFGTNGLLTNNLYTRVDEFEDALKCAIGQMKFENRFSYLFK